MKRSSIIVAAAIGAGAVTSGIYVTMPDTPDTSGCNIWPIYVARDYAERDGWSPCDFRFDMWPVSNASLHLPEGMPEDVTLVYRAEMPVDTPQANQYVEDSSAPQGYRPLPDPVGMTLSAVRFQLFDAETREVLADEFGGLTDSQVQAIQGRGGELWNRLTPGSSIRVQVEAYPRFYFLKEDGAAMLAYANMGERGYFRGATSTSPIYIMSLSEDGELTIREN